MNIPSILCLGGAILLMALGQNPADGWGWLLGIAVVFHIF
jgi:hypothetical protein